MADRPSPTPRQGATPAPAEPDAQPAAQPAAEPERGKPVVLATRLLEEFVLPAGVDDEGKAKGDPIEVTSAGVALSKTDAKRVLEAADKAGVTLIEKEA